MYSCVFICPTHICFSLAGKLERWHILKLNLHKIKKISLSLQGKYIYIYIYIYIHTYA